MIPNSQHTNPPTWLRLFVDDILRGVIDDDSTALIGCHFFHNDAADEWEVSLFASPTEVCGGPADGLQLPTFLQIDITAVASAFDFPPTVYWQAEQISHDDQLGNHLSFEGTACGFSVWLRILKNPPDWLGSGRRVHVTTGTVEEVW